MLQTVRLPLTEKISAMYHQHELREKLGYVPQKAVLFSGDIASNILYGNPDGSEAEMTEAATIAQATEFIEQKKKKYKSTISQGGSNVSGGQKQRLSIARAIAKHPDYIYLMIVSQHWIIRRMQHFVQCAERENIRKYGYDRRTENQHDSPCRSDHRVR